MLPSVHLLALFLCLVLLIPVVSADVLAEITTKVVDIGCFILQVLFYISASIAALFLLISGLRYTMSDSAEGRCQARNGIVYAIMGLVIILLACPLVDYFIQGTKIAAIPSDCCPLYSSAQSLPSASQTAPPLSTPLPPPSQDIFTVLEEIICGLLSIIYYIMAGIAAILILYAGIRYTLAEGLSERDEAKKVIVQAITGLVIVLVAVPLVNYLVNPYDMLDCGGYLVTSTLPAIPPQQQECLDCVDQGKIWCTGDNICFDDLGICHGLGCSGSCLSGASGCQTITTTTVTATTIPFTLCCTSPSHPTSPCDLCMDCSHPDCSEQNCLDCGYTPPTTTTTTTLPLTTTPTDCSDLYATEQYIESAGCQDSKADCYAYCCAQGSLGFYLGGYYLHECASSEVCCACVTFLSSDDCIDSDGNEGVCLPEDQCQSHCAGNSYETFSSHECDSCNSGNFCCTCQNEVLSTDCSDADSSAGCLTETECVSYCCSQPPYGKIPVPESGYAECLDPADICCRCPSEGSAFDCSDLLDPFDQGNTCQTDAECWSKCGGEDNMELYYSKQCSCGDGDGDGNYDGKYCCQCKEEPTTTTTTTTIPCADVDPSVADCGLGQCPSDEHCALDAASGMCRCEIGATTTTTTMAGACQSHLECTLHEFSCCDVATGLCWECVPNKCGCGDLGDSCRPFTNDCPLDSGG